jgi:hypothetical protein
MIQWFLLRVSGCDRKHENGHEYQAMQLTHMIRGYGLIKSGRMPGTYPNLIIFFEDG